MKICIDGINADELFAILHSNLMQKPGEEEIIITNNAEKVIITISKGKLIISMYHEDGKDYLVYEDNLDIQDIDMINKAINLLKDGAEFGARLNEDEDIKKRDVIKQLKRYFASQLKLSTMIQFPIYESEKVELKNGHLCPLHIVTTITSIIKILSIKCNDNYNFLDHPVEYLYNKSKDPNYKASCTNDLCLERFALLFNDKIPEDVRNIVISGGLLVDKDGRLTIGNPQKTNVEYTKEEKIQEMLSRKSEFFTDKKFVTSEMEISNKLKDLISKTPIPLLRGAEHKNAAIDLYKHCRDENHNIAVASYEILKKYDLLDSNSKTIKAEVKSLVLKGALELNDNLIRWKDVANTKKHAMSQ